jgi:hypothetical protein
MQTEIAAAPGLSVPPGYCDMARASAGAIGASMQSGDVLKTVNGNDPTFEPPAGYKKVAEEALTQRARHGPAR